MKSGTIKYYNPAVCEGKITPTSGADVNFEKRVVSGADPSTLVGGEPVQYDAVSTNERLVATRVVVLSGVIVTLAQARAAQARNAGPKPSKPRAKPASKPRAKPSKPRAKPASKPRAKRTGVRGKANDRG